jgi:hypothetical protein
MLEGLEKLKAILQERLSNDEVEIILADLTVASGEGSVSIGSDVNESVVVTGNKNIVGNNNQVIINYGTDAEELQRMMCLIRLNSKASSSPAADRKSRTVRGKVARKNTSAVSKPLLVKKSTLSPKKLTATQILGISRNTITLNNNRINPLIKAKALKALGRDAKGNNSAISGLLALIQRKSEGNDIIAEGITALSKISDDRSSIVSGIIKVLKSNNSSSVVISAMNAFGKIAVNNSDAIDKMLDLFSNDHNTTEMKESIIINLGKVANGNKKAIDRLICVLNSNQCLIKTRKLAADSLVQINMGDSDAISAMGDLLENKKLSISFKDYIAVSLNKVDPSNSKLAVYNKAKAKRK